jgi:hypothetical protein
LLSHSRIVASTEPSVDRKVSAFGPSQLTQPGAKRR